jgi:hypothetical protein
MDYTPSIKLEHVINLYASRDINLSFVSQLSKDGVRAKTGAVRLVTNDQWPESLNHH